MKLGVSGATPDLRASPRGAHLATATPAATGLAAVHALESRRRLIRPKRKPTAERPGGGRRVGRLMAPSIAIDIHPGGTAARVDVVNTFRCIRRSFHVVSRRFALSNSVFPQVTGPFAPSSIPGSSTTESAGQKAFWLACPRINKCGLYDPRSWLASRYVQNAKVDSPQPCFPRRPTRIPSPSIRTRRSA